ncbi:hypothetical protein [Terrimesophilobacter mesophilus]|uniref:EF-hand domain-containing protein n=1 Tax=Terrimesophilobacter mesophilus TaxID=433647 RepID=A0A4R8VDT2_9MICO|nr:hypothetical protein [Terrimesophilobacter mesophilus]TFB80320.1 hypothetical protein E3N84_09940 [Terrimesophilobacter mesophilus]
MLDLCERGRNAVLLFTEKVDRNRTGVVCFHELSLLTLKLLLLTLKGLVFGFNFGACFLEAIADHCFYLNAELRLERDALVVLGDLLFNFVDEHRFLFATGPLGVPSGAHEVWVFCPSG